MPVRLEISENTLIAYISEEIDHHSAKCIREEIDSAIDVNRPKELVLDFGQVGFMDSSGIGLVMGRYKNMQSIGGTIIIRNPSQHIKKVMRLAGIDRLATINS